MVYTSVIGSVFSFGEKNMMNNGEIGGPKDANIWDDLGGPSLVHRVTTQVETLLHTIS